MDRLELGKHTWEYVLSDVYFRAIEKTELLGGSVSATAVLDLREDDFSLRIKVHGRVQVTCDRCLDPMDIEVEAEEPIDREELEDEHELDLNWLAYEMIIVHLPLVHSHPDGGCNPEMAALLQNHLCSTAEEPEAI